MLFRFSNCIFQISICWVRVDIVIYVLALTILNLLLQQDYFLIGVTTAFDIWLSQFHYLDRRRWRDCSR